MTCEQKMAPRFASQRPAKRRRDATGWVPLGNAAQRLLARAAQSQRPTSPQAPDKGARR